LHLSHSTNDNIPLLTLEFFFGGKIPVRLCLPKE